MELVRGSASIWIPILIGLGTAVVGGAFLTAGRLRRELAIDVQLLQALPTNGRAQGHLNRSVQSRVLRLVGLTRYPALAATDLLCILMIVGVDAFCIALAVFATPPEVGWPTSITAAVLAAGINYAMWRLFYKVWSRRAVARLRFLSPLLDQDEADDLELLLVAAKTFIRAYSSPLIFGPGVALLVVTAHHLHGLPRIPAYVLWFVVCLIGCLPIYRVVDRSQLTVELRLHDRARRAQEAGSRSPGTRVEPAQSLASSFLRRVVRALLVRDRA